MNGNKDIKDFSKEWEKTMLRIWKDRINLMGIKDTGKLLQSFSSSSKIGNNNAEYSFKFIQYGLYQDLGVGRGYSHENNGNLKFLDKKWRSDNKKYSERKMRERRKWFTTSWWISTKVMKERMAKILGDEFIGLFDDIDNSNLR